MRRSALLPGIALLVLVAGCRGRSDLVEAELRTKDRELRETREQLEHARIINDALERGLIENRLPPGVSTNPQEAHAASIVGLKEIVLGRGTGGVDDDRLPGDDALQVVVTPRDDDASPIKVVGALRVEAYEITPAGTKVPLSTWDVTASDLRRTWRASLFSTGFHVVLPWKRPPASDRLRVIAQLILPDGKVFEADRDITIRLPAAVPLPLPQPREELLPDPQPEGPALSRLRPAELGRPHGNP